MKTISSDAFRHDKFAVVGISLPKRVISIVDDKAGKAYLARSAWLRQQIMDALCADLKSDNEK
jgi:hypothetical protein